MDNKKIFLLAFLILGLTLIFNISNINIAEKTAWPWITGSALYEKCTDTDDGLNYDIFGIVTKNDKSYQDECYTSTNFLKERYCENNELKTKLYKCPYGCLEGKCI